MFEDVYKGKVDKWQHEAANEFAANDRLFKQGKATHFAGIMQCYCDIQKENIGQKETAAMVFDV